VVALSRDVERWSADFGQGPIYVREGGLRSDPPEHTTYRRLVTGAFSARRVAEMEPFVRAAAEELVDGFASQGSADLCASFATPLPLIVIAQILGVPPERRNEFKQWSDEFMAGQNAADPAVQGRARGKIDAYFSEELDRRRAALAREGRAALPDDVLTSLISAEIDGKPASDAQLLPLLLLLLVGGNETTSSLIASLVHRLLGLGLFEATAADGALAEAAVEESLRIDPPVLGLFRTAKGAQCLHGVEIEPDAKVQGLYAAANRDPLVFEDPDRFRLDRDLAELRRTHLSFGVGIWLCPGAALARLEGRLALEVLGRRLAGLRLAGPSGRVASFMMWGRSTLPVAWDVVG
ncbi:MAG TPA: cytochrome P450, partial [Acidimicrobiales bacterium]|nr:cytochrome P450 [Acidimicrobiales bacterium]